MMNLLARLSNAKHKNRVLMTVVAISIPMLSPGCGIPKLQHAEPGPPLPERFGDADNLNYYRGAPTPDYFMEPAQSASFEQANMLASFTEPSNWVSLTDTSDAEKGTTVQANYLASANGGDLNDATDSVDGAMDAYDDAANDDATDSEEGPLFVEEGTERFVEPGGNICDNTSHIPLYEFFNDPLLLALFDQALVGNQELKILNQEVRIANLEIMARQGEYLPFVNFGARAEVDKPGEFTRAGAVEEQLEVKPGKGFPEPLPDFLVAANLTWELDIWRKLRNAKDAAALRFLGTRDGQNYIVTRMVAEIAENYYELLALDNRLITLDQTISIQEQSLKVAEAKKEAGRGTELAVQRFQAEVRKNQSEKLIIHQEIIEVENRINFLLGRYPQHVERVSANYVDLSLHALRTGVPSQLLRNRADVRQAERELAAAGLDVKVARARFYPSLALNAGVGYQAFNAKYLFSTPESLIYNVAGDLVAPLINKKAIRADYLSANAAQLQSVYNYQRTILNAFTEVTNRIAKVENYGESIEIKKQQLESLEASVDSASKLFQNARAEYVEVLLAQRDLMEAKMVLIQTKQQQLSAIVNAYQALGGGGIQLNFPQQ